MKRACILDKRGELTAEELVKIVSAIIGIGILVALSVGLYGLFTQNSEKQQALATIEGIERVIDNLDVGETGNYLMLNPKDWYLVSYSAGMGPSNCDKGGCLCSCKFSGSGDEGTGGKRLEELAYRGEEDIKYLNYFLSSGGISDCDKGVCVKNVEEIIFNEKISIGSFKWSLQFDFDLFGWSFTNADYSEVSRNKYPVNWHTMAEVPEELKIKKTKKFVLIEV